MASKKTYLLLILFIIVFGVVMFVLFGVPNVRKENIEATLVVGDNTTWALKKQKWIFKGSNSSMEQLNWQVFHVYEDNQYKGDFYLWHDDKWYAFDQNKSAINISGKFFAYDSNVEMKVYDFQESTIDDYTYVNQLLQENGISLSSKFTISYKVSFDFDGDSILEDFYAVSNALPIDFEPETTFSLAFMVKDESIYPLYTDISSANSYSGCKPYYHSFVDTDSDGVSEVILSCGQFSATDQVDMLFQFIDGDFKLLISNQ